MNAVEFLEDMCLGNIVASRRDENKEHDDDGFNAENEEGRESSTAAAAAIPATAASPAALDTIEIVPNLRTFNLVLATLATGGKFKKALEISAPMRDSRAAAAAGGRGGGRPRGGRREAGAVKAAVAGAAARFRADGETYTHLIVACGKGNQPDM